MRVFAEVDGSAVIARLDRVERGLGDVSGPLAEAAFWYLVRLWERIVRRPIHVYSAKYLKFLIRSGEISGKLFGILSGGLIGATAPAAAGAGGADLDARVEPGGEEAVIGFLNPAEADKARGFSKVHQRHFGEPAVTLTPGDERGVLEIFERWKEGLISGR